MLSSLLPALALLQEGGQPAPPDTTWVKVICGIGALVLLAIIILRRRGKKKKEEEF